MKVYFSIKNNFLLLFLLFLNFNLICSQIYDNFEEGILEEGSPDLLDVTDYHNIGLIVSSSKKIYTGIPPTKKTETEAKLIKVSSLITINSNYLLAACLEDSFLGKINLSTGRFVSLLSYSQIEDTLNDTDTLQIPEAICSLSNIDDTIFIGYSKIVNWNESYNTIFKFEIENKNDIDNGPTLVNSEEIKSFFFAKLKLETSSLRQISCEPLKILGDPTDYRLICLFESISMLYADDHSWEVTYYNVYAKTIKPDFQEDYFEDDLRKNELTSRTRGLGFRIFRENSTYARCLTGNSLDEIYLDSDAKIQTTSFSSSSYNLNADVDLISYSNKFTFSSQQISFMGKEGIYSFQINQKFYKNYFKLYNYNENIIQKILGYFNEEQNKIILLYQTDNSIKYFIMNNMPDIYGLKTFTDTIQVHSYQQNVEYDLTTLITNPALSGLGYLNVEQIKYKINLLSYDYEYLGKEFNELLMTNNILTPEPSLNDWKTYNLSFMENVEGKYLRIYHLTSLTISIETCKSSCSSCWTSYDTCTDCTSNGYAVLEDRSGECFPPDYLVDGYIYESSLNKFLKCYESCEFCTEVSTTSTSQKCSSCFPDYLYSYAYPGNCFPYEDLEISEDKIVDTTNAKFISSICPKYKIAATGECIDACPTTTPYYSYEYSQATSRYEKVYFNVPIYLLGNKCYEQCPENSTPNANNECVCNNYFYKDNDGTVICLTNENCPSGYPYFNQDTKECFSSLENCNYFFDDNCYENNCPNNKVLLSLQSEEVKNYMKEKLSLNNILINKICICDTTNGVWSNINANAQYYQECLNSCPTGYTPESLTKQCIITPTPIIPPTENNPIQNPISTQINAEVEDNISPSTNNNQAINPSTNNPLIQPTPTPPTPPPQPLIEENNNCEAKYENRCYPECPQGTCLTQEDPKLKTCIRISPSMQVFNGICFDNLDQFTNNIKSMSDSGQIISTNSGIIIHGYSTKPNSEKTEDKNANYSMVYLGDCEFKIKSFYNLPNDTELFILGIDSPNKDILSSTNVYNFAVYLENGTLLDHSEACKESKIAISSPIINSDLVKIEEANYFSDMGFDIFDESSDFYNDRCAAASIGGNDIILSDRKKDFYPEGVSLCNDSCTYSKVDLNSERFVCECDLNYNYSKKDGNEIEINEEDDTSYIDYILSLINYKIIKCYKLFFEYKSYYYNAGFYIAVGTLVFDLLQMFIYINCGRKSMDLIILENVPDERRLKEIINEQKKANNELNKKIKNRNNPPKNDKNKKISRKTVQLEFKGDLKNKRKSKLKNKTLKYNKKNKDDKKYSINNQMLIINSNNKLHFPKNQNDHLINGTNYTNLTNEALHREELVKDNIENRDLNIIPYTQALRVDKRNCIQIFLSVIFHEIKIISIFYYKHPFEHLSIILSQYMFELCLDLTLNCLLYTEDVISEKYNNNGSIKFFTTLSLSFMSNIISSIISLFLWKLADYADFFELIIKDITYKPKYYLNIMKFKKILCFKLSIYFFLQTLINLGMCYYLMIFCTIYHNTQGSIMINYLTGVAESMIISLALTLIISIMRAISIKCQSKYIYNTSKYFFENF